MGLRINAIAPGFTRSEMVDPDRPGAAERYRALTARHSGMNRLGRAEEPAARNRLAVLGRASYVNGAVLAVDGGGATRMY